MNENVEILQLFHMCGSGLRHELFGADIVKSDLQQGISAHLHHRQNHTLAKGRVLYHIAFVEFQNSLLRGLI